MESPFNWEAYHGASFTHTDGLRYRLRVERVQPYWARHSDYFELQATAEPVSRRSRHYRETASRLGDRWVLAVNYAAGGTAETEVAVMEALRA